MKSQIKKIKPFVLLVFIILVSGKIALTQTVGNTTVYPSSSTSGTRRAQPAIMPETGIIQTISINHDGGSGDMILAIYNDNNDSPYQRIAVTPATSVNSSAGWQTVSLTSPVEVQGGERIWLAWVFEIMPGIRYTSGTPGRRASSETWAGGMPADFGASTSGNYIYSIYGSYTTGTG